MRSRSLFGRHFRRERDRNKIPCRGGWHVMRFELLEARQLLAADFGWQAAGHSISDDAQAVPAMVAWQADAAATPPALMNSSADVARRLHEEASELPPSDVIDTLRTVKDIDALRDGNGAAGLPAPGDEDVNARTMVFDFLGDGSSKPDLPGASQGDDRGQLLDAMMETFRGGEARATPGPRQGILPTRTATKIRSEIRLRESAGRKTMKASIGSALEIKMATALFTLSEVGKPGTFRSIPPRAAQPS